jgi:hypothetical protein
MKLFPFPIATVDLARLFPVFVRRPLRLLLFSLTLSGTTLLAAAPAPPQPFHRSLTFEQNRRQAPNEVRWLGQSSSYRVLFEGDGATFLLPDKNDIRAMAGRRQRGCDRPEKRKGSYLRYYSRLGFVESIVSI